MKVGAASTLADFDYNVTLVAADRPRALSSLQAARLTSVGRCAYLPGEAPVLFVGGLGRGAAEVELVAPGARHLLHAGLLALVARVARRAAVPARQLGRRVQHGHEAGVRRRGRVRRRLAVRERRRRRPVRRRRRRVAVRTLVLQVRHGRRRRGRRGPAIHRRRRVGRRRRGARPAVRRRARPLTVHPRPSPHPVQLLQRAVLLQAELS